MAVATLSSVKRGVNGRFKTWQGEYTHDTGVDYDIVTGLTGINSFRIQNKTDPDVAVASADYTTTAGTITITDASLTDGSEMVVYAEGW